MSKNLTAAAVDCSDAARVALLLQETVVTAMETMAFFCTEPAGKSALSPEGAVRVSMSFSGSVSGTVELVAGKFFGNRMASNALGCGPTDEEACSQSADSIRELLNVVVGMMMPQLAQHEVELFSLSLPIEKPFEESEWEEFVQSATVAILDAEGETIALRLIRA